MAKLANPRWMRMSQERNIPKRQRPRPARNTACDNFVVGAEDMLANEAGRSSVGHCVGRHIVHCAHLKPDFIQILQG